MRLRTLMIICHTDSVQGKRARTFRQSAQTYDSESIHIQWIDYQLLIQAPDQAISQLSQATWIKWDTPGESTDLYNYFCQLGWQSFADAPRPSALLPHEIPPLHYWYAGLQRFLMQWAEIGIKLQWKWLNTPQDILELTDKWVCQNRLLAAGVAIPRLLGKVSSYDDLCAKMRDYDIQRVFVKAQFGSSAAGVFAYQRSYRSGKEHLQSCVKQINGHWLYYKKIFKCTNPFEIAHVINSFSSAGLYAEQWIPKPLVYQQEHADFRVLTLQGQVQHIVARSSSKVFTNLHLDANRLPIEHPNVQPYLSAIRTIAQQAAQVFPTAAIVGWDIIAKPRTQVVLEGNAFGDYLPRLLHQGIDPYQAQIQALEAR